MDLTQKGKSPRQALVKKGINSLKNRIEWDWECSKADIPCVESGRWVVPPTVEEQNAMVTKLVMQTGMNCSAIIKSE
jgi:hypothetical protein